MTGVLVRTFAASLEQSEGHTLTGRLVPYGEVAEVVDVDSAGEVVSYRESFARGVFGTQSSLAERDPSVARRVEFLDGHEGGLGKLGYALSLEERDDGLVGSLRVLPRHWEDVSTMVEDGVSGLSVGFAPLRNGTRVEDGVRVRTRAHLVHVALCPRGAYEGALVLAMRDAADDTEIEDAQRRAREDAERELDEWLARAVEEQGRLNALRS